MGATRRFFAAAVSLAFALGLAGVLAPAFAQQQEKRIALVVGNGAYSKAPLATAANDAGLIAQTLQAAGFDVVGARDLDGDTLRRSLRDFIQKAESSGPDTVAMIYLACYGVQLAGENYFIPVDSSVARETDIPTEGLRINDYVRRLGSLPLKASVVVLDAARQQPFVEGGQPIAGGLALVEPEPRMLIAFNAAPGTVAPVEQGPYGVYAQSLAEMIRTGGLALPELFDRLRLRVNDASKGAQVPWHAQKIDTNFVFFDRAPDAPAQAPPDQAAEIRNRPIRDLGARDAYAAALERDTLQGYDEFVAAYPGDPMARRVRALAAARREAITWMRTYRADTPQAYWSYLRRYPDGPHAADARRRLAILTAPIEPPPTFAVMDYDVPPPPPEEVIYIDRPVVVFSDPYYDFLPPPPSPVYFLPPPPPDFIILAPPPPPIGLFILPQPFFVPIPVYVRAPVYVAPPPNNIIFANIHNTTVINNVINRPAAPLIVGAPAPGQRAPGVPLGTKGGIPVAAPGVATPALPPSVAQKATLIQQGKAPVPPSASINPALAKPGVPGAPAGPSGAAPSALPANAPAVTPQGQPLPRANALPVPGAKGAPPLPRAGAAGVPTPSPNEKTVTPSAPGQSTGPAAAAPAAPVRAGLPKGPPPQAPASVVGLPKAGSTPSNAGSPPKPGSAALTPASPPPSSSAAGAPPKSGMTSVPKPPQGVQPSIRAPAVAPPPRIAAPSPPPRVNAPPPPPPRASAPPPPPARVAAPSPPPARIIAPPPPPRVSAPPPPRVSAPPPAPRMAAPPPPRMAAPPPRPAAPPPQAAVKRCPPNVPKC